MIEAPRGDFALNLGEQTGPRHRERLAAERGQRSLHAGREMHDAIVSMDPKKKELIGNFYRAGRLLTQGIVETFDHDFPSFASGAIIPHGYTK